MFDKIKFALNSSWAYLLGIIGLLLLVVGYEHREKLEAEAQVITADADKKDSVLQQQQNDVETQIHEVKTQAQADENKTLTPAEQKEFLDSL